MGVRRQALESALIWFTGAMSGAAIVLGVWAGTMRPEPDVAACIDTARGLAAELADNVCRDYSADIKALHGDLHSGVVYLEALADWCGGCLLRADLEVARPVPKVTR